MMSVISLTGPSSHRLERRPGVGVVTIGPAAPGRPRPDLVADPADAIDWEVFTPFTVPAGYPWPRRIVYEGDDTGFLRWAERRPIEDFDWQPHGPHDVDASRARIGRFAVRLRRAPLRLTLPSMVDGHFRVVGDPGLLTPALAVGAGCPSLDFAPDTLPARTAEPIRLPALAAFAEAGSVSVSVPPLRQAFDCASLSQFPRVRNLVLAGQLVNLDALARLRQLRGLQLRFCPDLSGLPPLHAWPELTHLIAYNVDDVTGRRLRGELRRSDRDWRDTNVTRLRKPEWFATEHGLPFAAWPSARAKAATRAYRAAEHAIAEAEAPDDVEAAIRAFVREVNRMSGIETTEREDAGEAVARLTDDTPVGNLNDAAAGWFDNERDF
jgi:hypothetical protein